LWKALPAATRALFRWDLRWSCPQFQLANGRNPARKAPQHDDQILPTRALQETGRYHGTESAPAEGVEHPVFGHLPQVLGQEGAMDVLGRGNAPCRLQLLLAAHIQDGVLLPLVQQVAQPKIV
jgi:hypothetical protein